MKSNLDTQHEALAAFVTTVDDAELTRLAQAYTEAHAMRAALRERAITAPDELRRVDTALFEATGKRRQELLARRHELQADVETLPLHRAIVERTHAAAHLAYLGHVRRLALAAMTQPEAELAPIDDEGRQIKRTMARGDGARGTAGQLSEQQEAELRQRLARLHEQALPIRDRLNQARETAEVCETRARMLYGEDVSFDKPHTIEQAVERAGAKLERLANAPVVRALNVVGG